MCLISYNYLKYIEIKYFKINLVKNQQYCILINSYLLFINLRGVETHIPPLATACHVVTKPRNIIFSSVIFMSDELHSGCLPPLQDSNKKTLNSEGKKKLLKAFR